MSAHPPPVPPEQQNKQGSSSPKEGSTVQPAREPNLTEQGRQGNIKQNTTNRGYQQDR